MEEVMRRLVSGSCLVAVVMVCATAQAKDDDSSGNCASIGGVQACCTDSNSTPVEDLGSSYGFSCECNAGFTGVSTPDGPECVPDDGGGWDPPSPPPCPGCPGGGGGEPEDDDEDEQTCDDGSDDGKPVGGYPSVTQIITSVAAMIMKAPAAAISTTLHDVPTTVRKAAPKCTCARCKERLQEAIDAVKGQENSCIENWAQGVGRAKCESGYTRFGYSTLVTQEVVCIPWGGGIGTVQVEDGVVVAMNFKCGRNPYFDQCVAGWVNGTPERTIGVPQDRAGLEGSVGPVTLTYEVDGETQTITLGAKDGLKDVCEKWFADDYEQVEQDFEKCSMRAPDSAAGSCP